MYLMLVLAMRITEVHDSGVTNLMLQLRVTIIAGIQA
jgi:hypothetical protein